MNKLKGMYCACIETKIPRMSRGSLKEISYGDGIERISLVTVPKTIEEKSSSQWVNSLKAMGLEPAEIELIYLRFFEEMKFKDIVKKCGWTSVGAASHMYSKVLNKLKKRGFKFK